MHPAAAAIATRAAAIGSAALSRSAPKNRHELVFHHGEIGSRLASPAASRRGHLPAGASDAAPDKPLQRRGDREKTGCRGGRHGKEEKRDLEGREGMMHRSHHASKADPVERTGRQTGRPAEEAPAAVTALHCPFKAAAIEGKV